MNDWLFWIILLGVHNPVEIPFPFSYLKKKKTGNGISTSFREEMEPSKELVLYWWYYFRSQGFIDCTMFSSESKWKIGSIAWFHWKCTTDSISCCSFEEWKKTSFALVLGI